MAWLACCGLLCPANAAASPARGHNITAADVATADVTTSDVATANFAAADVTARRDHDNHPGKLYYFAAQL